MGYTHYWNINKIHGNAKVQEQQYQAAIKDCNAVIKYWQSIFKGTEYSLSGYSAHADGYGGVKINGKQHLSCEDFCVREHFNQNEGDFCKTAQLPYDVVVTACLCLLKHHLGAGFSVDSDGDRTDWHNATVLIQDAIGLTVNNPIPVSRRDFKIVEGAA